jgi:para-aminobenzoate synthetase component 1
LGSLVVESLEYRSDTPVWFGQLAGRPWAMLLDSVGQPGGRYDIVVAEPCATLETRGEVTEIRGQGGGVSHSTHDPLDLLRRLLGPPSTGRSGPARDLPFVGGALGWLSYDLGRRIERLPATAVDPLGLPELALGIYDWALVVDHGSRTAHLVGRGGADSDARASLRFAYGFRAEPRHLGFRTWGPVETSLGPAAYRHCFERIQAYIHAGDCYQVNLARRLSVRADGDPWTAYRRLRELSPAPFSAYLNTPAGIVLSASPERFLRVRGGEVETSPIKGTAPRGATPEEDLALAEALRRSPKDRAENLMIVDLLRNDLGRTCAIGSVRVDALFELRTFASLHHLVSTVRGRLAPGQDALSLLKGAFPGGSITGAPKIRAMEIIEELEGERRGVYCGAIGYLGFDGSMDTSIAIRTAVYRRGRLWFWAGGGIVADSDPGREWEEIEVKARPILDLVAGFGAEGQAERAKGPGPSAEAPDTHKPLSRDPSRGPRRMVP